MDILAGQNRRVLRLLVAVVVLGALWLHWRAAYTRDVRAALDDLPASAERLDDLVEDLRDKRLAYRCKALLNDYRAGNSDMFKEHMADALDRVEHLERFAPLRRRLLR
jgi:uncharacterized protein YPO0396